MRGIALMKIEPHICVDYGNDKYLTAAIIVDRQSSG